MQLQAYSNDIDTYFLQPDAYLQRAKNHEFSKAWAVYRNINEDFSQSLAETQKELAGVPVCFWVEETAETGCRGRHVT